MKNMCKTLVESCIWGPGPGSVGPGSRASGAWDPGQGPVCTVLRSYLPNPGEAWDADIVKQYQTAKLTIALTTFDVVARGSIHNGILIGNSI